MLASLPMYDLPEIRDATDAFWNALAKAYGVSGGLVRESDWMAAWRNPALLFSQTCGYPFTHEFAGQLSYISTPHYKADGCSGPNYCSLIFARKNENLQAFCGTTAAYNNKDSMSGMLALKLAFAPVAAGETFFSNSLETGSHVASLDAVQSGKADVCAIDCVTAALMRIYRPSCFEGVVEIARSPQVPGLPYVTRGGDVERWRRALQEVCADSRLESTRDALLFSGFTRLPPQRYDVIVKFEQSIQCLKLMEFRS